MAGLLTASDRVHGTVMYPHGFDVRIRLLLPPAEALGVVRRLGLPASPDPKSWTTSKLRDGTVRNVLRGSAWLTGRRPRNARLPLSVANKRWGTRLYGIAVEVPPGGVPFIDLKGVRIGDVKRLLEDALGLAPDEHEVAYLRHAERFIVLSPFDAHRLAAALGGTRRWGSGTLSGKEFLVRDHEFPVSVRRRSTANATLNMYRVGRGATYLYKVEVALHGRARERRMFSSADVEKLDELLLGLVREHDLHPVAKPARWEPRRFEAPVEDEPYDRAIRALPHTAYAGSRPDAASLARAAKCHTPGSLSLIAFPSKNTGEGCSVPPSSRLMHQDTNPTPGEGEEEPRELSRVQEEPRELSPVQDGQGQGSPTKALERLSQVRLVGSEPTRARTPLKDRRCPWEAVAEEIEHLPEGTLGEVVLPVEQDPQPLLEALGNRLGDRLGVALLSPKNSYWYTALEAAYAHPAEAEGVETLVIVTDPEIVQAFPLPSKTSGFAARRKADREMSALVDFVFDEVPMPAEFSSGGSLQGSLKLRGAAKAAEADEEALEVIAEVQEASAFTGDSLRAQTRRVGAGLYPWIEALRETVERNGGRVIFVSADVRLTDGGTFKNERFTDSRVRSSLGDAARNLTHQRILVEGVGGKRVVLTKDGVEGLIGRVLFGGGA